MQSNRTFCLAGFFLCLVVSPGFSSSLRAQGIQVGYATLQASPGGRTPVASALFSFRNKDGILVSEAGVAAVAPISAGRIFVDQKTAPTGLALANPSAAEVVADLFLRNVQGVQVASREIRIPAHNQIARFMSDMELFPAISSQFVGTLTIRTRGGGKLAAVTLRQAVNANQEALLATLPVLDLDEVIPAGTGSSLIFPHLGAGGIITSQVILVNRTETPAAGTIRFFKSDGTPLVLRVDGSLTSEADFSLPGNGTFTTTLDNDSVVAGYAVVTVDQGQTPGGTLIFQFRDAQRRLISEAGVASTLATTRSRIFVDTVDTQTGIALAGFGNPAENIELILFDRLGRELARTPLALDDSGHVAIFVDQLFPFLPPGFTGLLEIRSVHGVAPVTLKLTGNERQQPILTTLPVADLDRPPGGELRVLPQMGFGSDAEFGSFSTRIILIETQDLVSGTGTLSFRSPSGQPLPVPLLGTARTSFNYSLAPGGALQLRAGNSATPAQIVIDPGLPTSLEVQVTAGDSTPLNPLVIDSEGALRDDFPLTFEALDSTIVGLTANGTLSGKTMGFSTITVATGEIVQTATASVVGVTGGLAGFGITGIQEDSDQRLYLSRSGSHTILLLEQLGQAPTIWAGVQNTPGNTDGSRPQSRFRNPTRFARDEAENVLYVCDTDNHTIRIVRPDGVSTLAGVAGQAGSADGIGAAARFNLPQGIVLDGMGNLWVADTGNHTIRKIVLETAEVVTLAGSAGAAGFADGSGSQARFSAPSGLAIERQPEEAQLQRLQSGLPALPTAILVADRDNGRIRRVGQDGLVSTVPLQTTPKKGVPEVLRGLIAETGLDHPTDIAVDSAGNLFVSEPERDQVRVVLRNGGESRLAPAGNLAGPRGLTSAGDGRILVADQSRTASEVRFGAPQITSIAPNQVGISGGAQVTVQGRNFAPDSFLVIGGALVENFMVQDTRTLVFTAPPLPSGQTTLSIRNRGGLVQASFLVQAILPAALAPGQITTVAGGSSFVGDGGPFSQARIFLPLHLAIDSEGNLYIADTFNNRIRRVESRSGLITSIAGTGAGDFGGDGGPAIAASLNLPEGLALDGRGNLYVSDSGNSRIRRIGLASGLIETVAGTGFLGYGEDDQPALASPLVQPVRLAIDSQGNLFFSDTEGLTLLSSHRIRCINLSNRTTNSTCPTAPGAITTVAGTGTAGYSGDLGPGTQAMLDTPGGIDFDRDGNLIFADIENVRIRSLNLQTGIIRTIAGTGQRGFSGDGGMALAARFLTPVDVAVDAEGNTWVADADSNRIRRIQAGTNVIQTVAGNGSAGFSGDGGLAIAASLNNPTSIVVDGSGAGFILDSANNRIRRIDPSGTIQTYIGLGVETAPGDGQPATSASLSFPRGSLEDQNGDILIGDLLNNRVRRVRQADKKISTLAGNGEFGFSGDGGAATQAALFLPGRISLAPDGDVLIVDTANGRIRRVDRASGTISTVVGSGVEVESAPVTTVQGETGGLDADLGSPAAVVSDSLGNLYISDSDTHRILRWDARTQRVTTIAGNQQPLEEVLLLEESLLGDEGPATAAPLAGPEGLALDSANSLFVADRFNNRIRQIDLTTGIITTVWSGCSLLQILLGQCPDNIADRQGRCDQTLVFPQGLTTDVEGNLYFTDLGGVCRISRANGLLTHLAGNDCVLSTCSLGDGQDGRQASLLQPSDVAVTGDRDLLITDSSHGRIRLLSRGAAAAKAGPQGAAVLYLENVEGAVDDWAVDGNVPGGWVFTEERSRSPHYSFFASDQVPLSDTRLSTAVPIRIPANATNPVLTFWHHYSFEDGFDGGVVEFSDNGGASWFDVDGSFLAGPYTGILSSFFNNPLGGRPAFTGESDEFVFSAIAFNFQIGADLLIRFRVGTDAGTSVRGWNVDDIQLLVVLP